MGQSSSPLVLSAIKTEVPLDSDDPYETSHVRTGQPVVGKQLSSSFVPSVIKTEVLLDCDDHAHTDLLLQKYGERIEKLSCHNKTN